MPWLQLLKGGTPGTTFPLNQEVTVLGRDPACEIVLSDQGVSKRHARIVHKVDRFEIEDLGSLNGTKVAGQDVTRPHRLEDGDAIEVGDTQLVFIDSSTTITGSLDVSRDGTADRAGRSRRETACLAEDRRGARRHDPPGWGPGEDPRGVVHDPSPGGAGVHPAPG